MLYYIEGDLMYSKVIQKIVLITVILVIFGGVYKYLADEYQQLPSENWSKDETLFSFKTDTELASFFESQLAYINLDELLSIVYIEGDVLRYKSYNRDLTLQGEGILTSLSGQGQEIYARVYDDGFEMIIKVNDDFYCYRFDKQFKLKRTYVETIEQANYYVSNGHIVLKENKTLKLVSSKGAILLDMPNTPYDNVVRILFDGLYTVHYLSIIDGERFIVRDVYDEAGVLLETETINKLLNSELRLGPLDFEVVRKGDIETYKINVKDHKSGQTYLNYFQYNISSKVLLKAEKYERFQDKTTMISSNEMIGLYKGSEIASLIGKNFQYFYNIMIYNFDSKEIKALTKTYNSPREYIYVQTQPYDYLIWGELKKGEMTIKIASSDPTYIKASQVFTRERILDVFYETIEAYLKIPTYIIINGVSVFAITMLIIMPAYMVFITFFEKHNMAILLIMIVLHNIGKFIIHVNFLSRVSLPAFLESYTIPIIIMTNVLAFYNYKVINHHRKLDNPIVCYIPFFITDILLHTFIFGPFIMMRF